MADNVSVNNDGGAPDPYLVSTEELADASHVANNQLVTVSGTTKTDLAKAEDAAHVSGDMGLQVLAVRTDTAASRSGTDGDYTPLIVDSLGRLHVSSNIVSTSIPAVVTLENAFTGAQANVAIVSVTSPDRIVVTRLLVTADNANSVDVGVRIGLAAATTPTTTGVVGSHPGIAPGQGFSTGDGSGVLGIGAAGEDLRITSEVPTGGSIRVVVSYYLTT